MNNNSILIIDDEVQIRRLLSITLEMSKYKVLVASNAKEGLMAAAMHSPTLIILDLGLPDEDGQSVLRKLREWYKNPIIILSARTHEEEIVKALDSGANDYLTKPFHNGELLAHPVGNTFYSGRKRPIGNSLIWRFNHRYAKPLRKKEKRNYKIDKY